jgi:Flp pilus assembly protein TadB
MAPEPGVLSASVLIGALMALPALEAAWRRRRSRQSSALATALVEFAATVRREQSCRPLDAQWLAQARRLAMPELVSFELAQQLARPDPALLAESAQRLALRLKRRVAFERKMLARTAPGRRRAAVVAAAPIVILFALSIAGQAIPIAGLLLLLGFEALGCWLLWRVSRVQV